MKFMTFAIMLLLGGCVATVKIDPSVPTHRVVHKNVVQHTVAIVIPVPAPKTVECGGWWNACK